MKVKFMPQNVEFEIKPSESILHVAHNNGIHIKSVCKGVPSCAECRVQILEGDHNVFPPTGAELSLIGTAHFVDHSRLACQLKCYGDVTIDLTEQIEKAQRTLSTKKLRGGVRGKMAEEDSSAVQGNIIFDETGPNQEDISLRKAEQALLEEERRMAFARIRRAKEQAQRGPTAKTKGVDEED